MNSWPVVGKHNTAIDNLRKGLKRSLTFECKELYIKSTLNAQVTTPPYSLGWHWDRLKCPEDIKTGRRKGAGKAAGAHLLVLCTRIDWRVVTKATWEPTLPKRLMNSWVGTRERAQVYNQSIMSRGGTSKIMSLRYVYFTVSVFTSIIFSTK